MQQQVTLNLFGKMISEPMDQGTRPLDVRPYQYHNKETDSLEFDGMMHAIEEAKADGVFLLHVCVHNPTGIDPTRGQWNATSDLCLLKRLFPFFDLTLASPRKA